MLSTLGALATEKEKEFKKFEEFRSSRRRIQEPESRRREMRRAIHIWSGAALVRRGSGRFQVSGSKL
jgi:hypothetical protein